MGCIHSPGQADVSSPTLTDICILVCVTPSVQEVKKKKINVEMVLCDEGCVSHVHRAHFSERTRVMASVARQQESTPGSSFFFSIYFSLIL